MTIRRRALHSSDRFVRGRNLRNTRGVAQRPPRALCARSQITTMIKTIARKQIIANWRSAARGIQRRRAACRLHATLNRRALSHDLSWSRQPPRRGLYLVIETALALTGPLREGAE